MKVLIIICNSKKNSFNHLIAQKVASEFSKNHDVIYHDLYEEKFEPLLTQEEVDYKDINQCDEYIQKACKELSEADVIVIVHPNWWGQPPALLKGWIDRVFRAGISHKFTKDGAVGLLKAKKAYIFNTSNTPENIELSVYHDPLDNLWKTCIFNMCGVNDVQRVMFKEVITSTEKMRQDWLNEVVQIISPLT